MKKIVLLSLLSLFIFSCSSSKQSYAYEMYCQGVESQGSNLVKVYSYASSQEKAIEKAKHDAVHGILFKGIVGGNGCSSQPPIVKPEELTTHSKFFDNFFKSGEYLRFVSISSDGTTSANDRLKVGKQYKVGVIVSVNKNELRKYLENNNVIKKLGYLFK